MEVWMTAILLARLFVGSKEMMIMVIGSLLICDFLDETHISQNQYSCDSAKYSRKLNSTFNPHRFLLESCFQEMESVFGMPPSTANRGFISDSSIAQEPQSVILDSGEREPGLTHVDRSGGAQMVDICRKGDSKRVAIASCRVTLGETAFNLVAANQIVKGDVLNVAKIAGISAAKQTSNLIPLCHNISLTHVRIDLMLNKKDFSVEIEGEAATMGKTGVEMEAMTAVTVAGLTVYDMCKAASKDIQITDVRLEHKSGGKSGEWSRKQ